jgi:hypothetical protein
VIWYIGLAADLRAVRMDTDQVKSDLTSLPINFILNYMTSSFG